LHFNNRFREEKCFKSKKYLYGGFINLNKYTREQEFLIVNVLIKLVEQDLFYLYDDAVKNKPDNQRGKAWFSFHHVLIKIKPKINLLIKLGVMPFTPSMSTRQKMRR